MYGSNLKENLAKQKKKKIINIKAKENLTQSTKFYQKEIVRPFKILKQN